jgi:hypothetical protein
MAKNQSAYEGYQDDIKEIKAYLKYIYLVLTCNGNPELIHSFAEHIREWKKENRINY